MKILAIRGKNLAGAGGGGVDVGDPGGFRRLGRLDGGVATGVQVGDALGSG